MFRPNELSQIRTAASKKVLCVIATGSYTGLLREYFCRFEAIHAD
jgi:hypothetical protein